MKTIKIFCLLFCLLGATQISAQQPYGACWHPSAIKNWDPSMDPDFKFNKATVKLQPRFKNLELRANPYQHEESQVCAMITMNQSCSQTPSQDANNFIGCNPTFWQYLDIVVWWGGSASEGIIVPPSAPAIDAAHMNGTKILGTIFFPPFTFGGTGVWIDQMQTKENGRFIYAQKLYEIAKAYGFDGWMMNEETYGGGNTLLWAEFIEEFNRCKKADGNDHMILGWYDNSMSVANRMSLLQKDGLLYMMEYASSKHINKNLATWLEHGFSEKSFFEKNFMGCQQDIAKDEFDLLFTKEKHNGSVYIFKPEENTWKKEVQDLLETSSACGPDAYYAMNRYFNNENKYWVNTNRNPSSTNGWNSQVPGLSTAVIERSAIQKLPFVTTFSTGLGKHRFVNGEKKGTQDWYHRGMQDILPTWRWWKEAGCNFNFAYNWDDAYNVGTSIKITGSLIANKDNLIRLYKTNLNISNGDKFQLVYKTNVSDVIELKLGTSNNTTNFETFPLRVVNVNNGWTIAEVDLSSIAGKTVSVIALNFKSPTTVPAYVASLGQLGIFNANYDPAALVVSKLETENELKETEGDIRLIWEAPISNDIHHYNIYLTRGNERTLVGQTRNEGFYIPTFSRLTTSETEVIVEVSVVTNDLKENTASKLEVKFPPRDQILVSLKASKSLISVNEEVSIEAIATNGPHNYQWIIPDGAVIVNGQGTSKATFKFTKEGCFDISVQVTNDLVSIKHKQSGLLEVNNNAQLELVSVGKSFISASGWNEGEGESPQWLLDGITIPQKTSEKWCAAGKREHWVVIDLKQLYKIYRLRFFDCGNREGSNGNVTAYKMWVSQDAKTWTLVLDEKNRPEDIKDDYIAPNEARYVKFMPYNSNKPCTIRIYEFEVYATESGEHSLQTIEDRQMGMLTTEECSLNFEWGGNATDDYEFSVQSDNDKIVKVENLKTDLENNQISFSLMSQNISGKAKVTVLFRKGSYTKSSSFIVTVRDLEYLNRASGKNPRLLLSGSDFDNPEAKDRLDLLTDQDHSSYWVSSYSPDIDCQLEIDLGECYTINKIALVLKHNAGTTMIPSSLFFHSAERNTDDYSLLFEKTNNEAVPQINNGVNEYLIEPTPMRYVKLTIPGNQDYMGVAIAEIEIYGKEQIENNLEKINLFDIYKIYPNPLTCGDNLKIDTECNISEIQIVTIQGVTVLQEANTTSPTTITTSNLPQGTYILMVKTEKGLLTQKLIIK